MIKYNLDFTTSKLLAFIMLFAWMVISILLVIKAAYTQVVPFTAIMIPTIGAIASVKNLTAKK